jgi:cell fate (sporulation/competence/biofilm development) regulator YlbF (YheA/YmcA/DUF963 family)|tara:strand:- start:1 stop:357 length:357 start_codon:yes stop_codon:yes gene_type:complete
MDRISEIAMDLGRLLGQSGEYQVLKQAISIVDEDTEVAEIRTKLESIELQIKDLVSSGSEPDESVKKTYEESLGHLQTSASYQRLVAAQANFDKVLVKVNQTIQSGMSVGAESRILLP